MWRPWCSPRNGESRTTITGEIKGLEVDHSRHSGIDGMLLVKIASLDLAIVYADGGHRWSNCDEKSKEIAVHDTLEATEFESLKPRRRIGSKFRNLVSYYTAVVKPQTFQFPERF